MQQTPPALVEVFLSLTSDATAAGAAPRWHLPWTGQDNYRGAVLT